MDSSSLARLPRVLVSPRAAFEELREKPVWAAALVVILIATACSAVLIAERVDIEDMVRGRMAAGGVGGDELSDEQLDNMVRMMTRARHVMFVVPAVLFQPLALVATALAFWLVFRALGGTLRFRQSFSVVVHGSLPWVVAAVLSIPILLTTGTIDAEQLQSGGVLSSNLGILVSDDAGPVLRTIASSIDFFSLWTVFLLALGYSIVGRLSAGTTGAVVGTGWALWIAIKTGMALLGGMVGGG